MQITQTNNFRKAVKKLHKGQKRDLDTAVVEIKNNPNLGQSKSGDLKGKRVHKFRMNKQPVLMAYEWNVEDNAITLLALGSHENFYRHLKG